MSVTKAKLCKLHVIIHSASLDTSMDRGKSSVSSRLLEFPHHSVALDHTRKSTLARHLTLQAHKEKAETNDGQPARKRQLTVIETLPNKDVNKRMNKDLVKAFVGRNIPLSLLDHPLF